nr:hypothetical protein [Tanacetum cinerariifolium]
EKGSGPNWLFDIDSLTKSMNYVPVDACTISTNLSGTKDAASQEVKKDVSSLRYTALPNWTHDALLEFSLSKPQDHYSTEVPEGSGNPNSTASTSNPPADQMETLTVETPIPTVSSPILTAYSTNSQEPSSDARLISKRVANQVETPSLDNILSLSNRFEDILGVTTNSDESNRVEADISNMETTITASPTPTFRIYKDHPKSQIIGPLDTPIQTRNKSKEVEEQSFIATIHQKTNPALLQFCLFSCFLSQVEPKKISDALQDPSCVEAEAMQEELLQFKIQNVWTLVDCPKGLCGEFEALIHEKFQMSAMAASCCGQVLWIQNQLLDYRHHFIRDCFEKKHISVDHIHTDENVADLLTKPFDAGRFQYIVCKLFPLLGKLSTVSVFLGFGLTFAGTFKYWGVLRILMISLRLIPLGAGSDTPTEPHHTPSTEAQSPSHTTHTSPTLPPITNTSISTVTPSDTPIVRQYTRRTMIAQSFVPSTVADEPASPLRDVSQGEACPTDSGFIADQDRETIANLQRQHSELLAKFQAHEVEINRLKERVKLLEDRDGVATQRSGDDAPIKGRSLDEWEAATERTSDDTEEMENILTSMDTATILASGAAEVPTGSGSIPTAGPPAAEVPIGNDVVPTTSPVFATTTVVTPYRARKGKEVMVESETPKKQKVQEQIDAQVARELEEQQEREDQRRSAQIARDAEIARIYAEEEL